MEQEIGKDRKLREVAEKFVELFRGMEKRRATCLKVCTLYSGRLISKEADLPPWELEEFKRAFDPNQPRLCQECAKALPAEDLVAQYCSNACQQAGKTFHCRKCQRPMILKNDFPHCPTCKLGGHDWKPQEGDTIFSRSLKRFSEQFNWFVQNVHPHKEKSRATIMSLRGRSGSPPSVEIIFPVSYTHLTLPTNREV